jgi:dihydroorotase
MVREAKRAGAVAVKFYPEGVTTNAEDGLADIFDAHDVLREIRDQDLVLCLHGETPNHDPDTAEQKFLRDLLDLVRCFPGMRIVFEHVTSAKLVKTIERLPPNVAATITAHHLFLTKGDVYSGKTLTSPHHFCKPLAKQAKDREALCRVILEGNPKFFLGSDSAPHLRSLKEGPIECCPAGVYTAPILAPVLAEFFLRAGGMHRFEGFTSGFGRAFYRLPPPTTSLTLVQMPWEVPAEYDGIVPFMAGRTLQFQLAS